ncbi:MAG: hypothetical protein OXI39_04485 [Gemmatimonadota bacterium]|uniref:DUF4097 family beta strand repeat-containing protein n=1 Tax=Candidatus Palauibacter scopulicola TaxID=3056741 RepID=UPI0023911DF6|nr:hypothetical protein [Candidatus Palauibacter scopulicola]MDE2662241.1 hypothetical protein [Candidatus Palauibacter scopulicola]
MMRNTVRQLAAAAAWLVCLGAVEARAQDFEWQGSVDPGDAVTIRGVNGSIVASAASGGQVRVRATKQWDDDDPDAVRIEVVEDRRGVLICAVYPSRRGRDPNRCGREGDYEMNVRDNDVKVHFTVEVPPGVDLEARTVNGEIETQDISDEVEARTVNGNISVAGAGPVSATTVNGSIEARLASQPSDDLRFVTVNGGIRLVLPAGIDADVSIRTVNGAIDTEFPLTIRGRWGPRSASGEIGDGGPEITLGTVNGGIALVRGG